MVCAMGGGRGVWCVQWVGVEVCGVCDGWGSRCAGEGRGVRVRVEVCAMGGGRGVWCVRWVRVEVCGVCDGWR